MIDMTYNNSHKGQILLITLLVLSIATTIAVSLIARSTTDLKISNQADESSRAFSAAEAGIEEALLLGNAPIGDQTIIGTNEQYNVKQFSIGDSVGAYAFRSVTPKGQSETLWLVPHSPTEPYGPDLNTPGYEQTSIDVCIGNTDSALEVITYYKDRSVDNFYVARGLYDSNLTRAADNKFSASFVEGSCGDGTNTSKKITINFSDFFIDPFVQTLIMMRFRPLYADTQIAVNTGSAILPKQGNTYESCGKTGAGIQRCISVVQNYRTPPGLFDYVIYSNTGSFAPVSPN